MAVASLSIVLVPRLAIAFSRLSSLYSPLQRVLITFRAIIYDPKFCGSSFVSCAMVKAGLDVKKGGTPFRHERSLGLLWEEVAQQMIQGGAARLEHASLNKLLLRGGCLQLRVAGQWLDKQQITIDMDPVDVQLVKDLVRQDWENWSCLPFNVTAVDQKMKNNLGYHDALGFFTTPERAQQCPGLVSLEKKIVKSWGFDNKVQKLHKIVAERFGKLQACDDRITGQLLSVSQLADGGAIDKTVLYFLPTPEGQWERLQVVSSRCQAMLDKMNWFTALSGPLAGEQVASVGSFLRKSGKLGKHANSYVKSWGDGSVPGVSKQSFPKLRLRQQRGGTGHVSTKTVFKKVFKYLS